MMYMDMEEGIVSLLGGWRVLRQRLIVDDRERYDARYWDELLISNNNEAEVIL